MKQQEAPAEVEKIVFEQRDVEIFNIPDLKTRLNTLQNYFFPRLEALLKRALEGVKIAFATNPYEKMTFVYKPSHRRDAKENFTVDEVFIGVCGKRRTNRPLTILRGDGKPFSYHSTYLTFNITLDGLMYVELMPFRQHVDKQFLDGVGQLVRDNEKLLSPILALHHVAWTRADEYLGLVDSFCVGELGSRRSNRLRSPMFDLPLETGWGLSPLVQAFIALYPLAEAFTALGEGETPVLDQRLEQYKSLQISYIDEQDEPEDAEEDANDEVFARAANELQLTNRQVNLAHLQALAWAESLNE